LNLSKHAPIKILGGGIAGLSAGIFLKQAGYDPIIYEKNKECGYSRHGDIEGLETWNFCTNPIHFFKQLNIPIEFNFKPENKIMVHFDNSPSLIIVDKSPFFYFVKRGKERGYIDRELQTYALSIGCEIRFGFSPKIENISIIATGSKKANAYIQGITFETQLPDQTHLFLNNSLTKKGYGYLIIWNGQATLSIAYKKDDNNNKLKNIILKCKDKLGIEIPNNVNPFASYGSFDINSPKIDKNGRLIIGEAGGLQDYLFGFGMNSAIHSAYYATKSIIHSNNYELLVKQNIIPHMKASLLNRYLFEKLNENQKYNMCKRLSTSQYPLKNLQKQSNYTFKKKLMFKLLNRKLKKL
jgi:flavin-dependent dehydrogenase